MCARIKYTRIHTYVLVVKLLSPAFYIIFERTLFSIQRRPIVIGFFSPHINIIHLCILCIRAYRLQNDEFVFLYQPNRRPFSVYIYVDSAAARVYYHKNMCNNSGE